MDKDLQKNVKQILHQMKTDIYKQPSDPNKFNRINNQHDRAYIEKLYNVLIEYDEAVKVSLNTKIPTHWIICVENFRKKIRIDLFEKIAGTFHEGEFFDSNGSVYRHNAFVDAYIQQKNMERIEVMKVVIIIKPFDYFISNLRSNTQFLLPQNEEPKSILLTPQIQQKNPEKKSVIHNQSIFEHEQESPQKLNDNVTKPRRGTRKATLLQGPKRITRSNSIAKNTKHVTTNLKTKRNDNLRKSRVDIHPTPNISESESEIYQNNEYQSSESEHSDQGWFSFLPWTN